MGHRKRVWNDDDGRNAWKLVDQHRPMDTDVKKTHAEKKLMFYVKKMNLEMKVLRNVEKRLWQGQKKNLKNVTENECMNRVNSTWSQNKGGCQSPCWWVWMWKCKPITVVVRDSSRISTQKLFDVSKWLNNCIRLESKTRMTKRKRLHTRVRRSHERPGRGRACWRSAGACVRSI